MQLAGCKHFREKGCKRSFRLPQVLRSISLKTTLNMMRAWQKYVKPPTFTVSAAYIKSPCIATEVRFCVSDLLNFVCVNELKLLAHGQVKARMNFIRF